MRCWEGSAGHPKHPDPPMFLPTSLPAPHRVVQRGRRPLHCVRQRGLVRHQLQLALKARGSGGRQPAQGLRGVVRARAGHLGGHAGFT